MPVLSQWGVRAAFAYLLLGFTVGALLLINKGMPLHPVIWSWLPAHIEFLLLGWVLQLTMAVAFWILPRHPRLGGRGNLTHARLAFLLLNLGIWLVVLATVGKTGRSLLWLGRAAELAGVLLFVRHAWLRVLPHPEAKTDPRWEALLARWRDRTP